MLGGWEGLLRGVRGRVLRGAGGCGLLEITHNTVDKRAPEIHLSIKKHLSQQGVACRLHSEHSFCFFSCR